MRWPFRRRSPEAERATTLRAIRANLAAIGQPVDGYSDAQIETAAFGFVQGVAKAGVTAEEALAGLRRITTLPAPTRSRAWWRR
jgi:hypothetical protein